MQTLEVKRKDIVNFFLKKDLLVSREFLKYLDKKIIGKFCFEKKRSFFEKLYGRTDPFISFLQIIDNSYDRKILFGFFICLYSQIIEEIHNHGGDGGAG